MKTPLARGGMSWCYCSELPALCGKTQEQLADYAGVRDPGSTRFLGLPGRSGRCGEMSELCPSLELALGELLRRIVREEISTLKNEVNCQDRLLDAAEAAKLLCVSEDWLYRNGRRLPFTRKLGPKMLRFSALGIQKYLAARKIG
jgi:predicted DNA-binding transcriptional regulator AlpA